MHPLVQAWSRDSVISTSQHYSIMSIQVLTVCSSIDNAGLHRYLLPHILDMLDQRKCYNLHVQDMISAGRLLKDQGHHQNAAALFERALENMKTAADRPKEEDVITVLSWLASAYKNGGRWSQAEKLQVEVLEQQTIIMGAGHLDTIRAAGNLAITYGDQGRFEEAEKLEVEVLEQLTRILGAEYPDTIMAAGNLAIAYGDQGRLEEAEKLQVQVLEQRTRILGAEHPDTILAAASLAVIYIEQRRLEDAASLLAPAVQLSIKVIGQEHPETQCRAADLEYLYEKLGKPKEAQEMKDLLLS